MIWIKSNEFNITNNNHVIPSIETAHYVIFFLPDWSLHRITLLLVTIQLTQLHRLNLLI